MAINVKTMLNVDELKGNVVIDKNGYAYYESDLKTKISKNKITGIYSKQETNKILAKEGTRIKGNDAIFKLTNEGSLGEYTIKVTDYFKNNGKSSFVNVAKVEDNEVKDSLNIINDGILDNKNLYNFYNLAENHDGNITKSTIQGTVFNDTVDLSNFKSEQLKIKNKALKSITIKTGKGDDTITGSIINDNITGGAGENTLNFTDYSGKITVDSAYGDDIYNLTSGETLNLEYAGTDRANNLSYAKVGNDIVITDTVTNSVKYTRTKITGDTVATKYTKVETTTDSDALKFEKVVVTVDAKEGDWTVSTQKYKVNGACNDWEKDGDAAVTTSDTEVQGSTTYNKYVNGSTSAEKLTDITDDNQQTEIFDKEGKYQQYVQNYVRNKSNTGWEKAGDAGVTVVSSSVVKVEKIYKYVDGGVAKEYSSSNFDDEGKYNKTTTTYIVKNVDDTYSWDGTPETEQVDEAVEASDIVYRAENAVTTTVATGDKAETYLEYPPADIGGSIEAQVGSLTLKNLGKNNNLADVKIGGSNLFDTSSDRVFVIDGTKGGTIQGTKGNDRVKLGNKNATLSAVVGKDAVYAGTGAVTFNLADQAQNLIDGYEINELLSEADVVVSDGKNEISVYNAESMKSATVVDNKKVKYNVEVMYDSTDLSSTKGNNIIFSESENGMDLKTGTGNDVVIMNNSPDTKLDVATENLTQELKAEGFEVVESDKTQIQRAITDKDLKEVENFKYDNNGHYSRDVVAADVTGTGLEFVDASHVSKQLTSEDITLGEGASYQVKGGKGYIVKAGEEDRLVTKDDVVEAKKTSMTVDEKGLVDCRETTSDDLKTISDFTYADGKYSRDVVITDLTSDVSGKFSFVNSSTIKRNAEITSDDLVLTDLQKYEKGVITTSYLNTITYTGGNDAYRGSKTNDVYNINSMNNKTIVTINDLGGEEDVLDFTNSTLKDMTIFFDYDKTNKMTGVTDLKFISDSSIKANKLTSGYVEVKNYFDGSDVGNVGVGNIETVKTSSSGSSVVVGMSAKIEAIKGAVATWFDNNGNYDSAMDVINAGNKADIQSLMLCYSNGTVAV